MDIHTPFEDFLVWMEGEDRVKGIDSGNLKLAFNSVSCYAKSMYM